MPPSAANSGEKSTSASGSKVTQADLQTNAPDQYTVVKGDTLWGIAGKFLKDPWKWPQIWNMNRDQVKDPHWIYPGDVIRLDRSGANPSLSINGGPGGSGGSGGTSDDAAANVVRIDPRIRIEPLQEAIPTIPTSAIGPFLTRPLIVETDTLAGAPKILATQENRVVVAAGDKAYVDRIGTADGVNWQVYRPSEPINDPESGELLGYSAKYVGDARVRRFGEPTTIEVTRAREEINSGDRLMPARESGSASFVPRAPGKPLRGTILSVDGGVAEFGQYSVVSINRGGRDGVEVGYVLASLHRGGYAVDGRNVTAEMTSSGDWFPGWLFHKGPSDATQAAPSPTGAPAGVGAIKLPDERNGLVMIFRVFDKMSYGLVMNAISPINVGDVVQTP